MPIFEYECLACRRQFEQLVRTADAQVACPDCASSDLRRLISLSGFSTESSSAANLSAAHRRAAAKRSDKARAEHAANHDHFGDTSSSK